MDISEKVRQFIAAGVHVELTNLVIPGQNDSDEQLQRLVDFVSSLEQEFSVDIPLHFSAYHPAWKMTAPATPRDTLLRARSIALGKLRWVYLGNVAGSEGRDTHCPECGRAAIVRSGFRAEVNLTSEGCCPGCGSALPVVMT